MNFLLFTRTLGVACATTWHDNRRFFSRATPDQLPPLIPRHAWGFTMPLQEITVDATILAILLQQPARVNCPGCRAVLLPGDDLNFWCNLLYGIPDDSRESKEFCRQSLASLRRDRRGGMDVKFDHDVFELFQKRR